MSLKRKFAILFALLGLTVLFSLGAAAWSFRVLQTEVATPFTDLAQTLSTLSAIKQELAGGRDEASRQRIDALMKELAANDAALGLVGVSTSRNLRQRVAEARAALPGDPAPRRSAIRLIERIETQIAGNADLALGHVAALRRMLTGAMAISLFGAVMVALLGYLLLNRWVVAPVASLRLAAKRIGGGDFAHRVPVNARDEIGLLSEEVNRMAALVSRMQEERIRRERLAAAGQMLRRLAHNLRNPLAGIRSLAELSREDASPDSEVCDAQNRIMSTVDHFERWLSDLLHRTSPVELRAERLDVGAWIRGVVAAHESAAAARSVRIEIEAAKAPRNASFDPGHLEQAISVLVSNAIDASPRGSTVRISVRTDGMSESWELRVEDEGPGVAPEIIDRIFEPHFTTKQGGVGIGLAFAREVAMVHGGEILVEPGCGGSGAAFVIRLPLGAGGKSPVACGELQPI